MKKDIIIGIECHAELSTNTKLFCGCSRESKLDELPNSRVCEVCLGMPGSKPVLNKKALEFAIKLCKATNCKLSKELIFSRKSYFYPDMSKNYQITQHDNPLGSNGFVVLSSGKKVNLKRIHLEEDPASLVHPDNIHNSSFVLVDYNRSGNPLVEIVSEPELFSPDEARDFMKQLISILNYLKIFDVDNCIIKADANISIGETGNTRVEIKNITGFKEIERALNYELERQKQSPGDVVQETRGWDSVKGITFSLRKKEQEEDYGYIIDPDLVPVKLTKEMLNVSIPELAHHKAKKFQKLKVSKENSVILASDRLLAELFEKVAEKIDPVLAAKWLRRELLRVLNLNKKSLKDLVIDERHIIELLGLVEKKVITDSSAKEILELLIKKPFSPKDYVSKKNISKISDEKELLVICKKVFNDNPKAVADLKNNNPKSLQFLVGQVMRLTKGKADPLVVNKIFSSLLK